MEVKVDQVFGDIQFVNVGFFFQWMNIENIFVCYVIIVIGVEYWVGVFQLGSDVVGVKDCVLVCLFQFFCVYYVDIYLVDW